MKNFHFLSLNSFYQLLYFLKIIIKNGAPIKEVKIPIGISLEVAVLAIPSMSLVEQEMTGLFYMDELWIPA